MPPRGYVLVFFFWALLTVITPTLIFWSASAKPNLDSQGEFRNEVRTRRMMGSIENGYKKNTTTTTTTTATTTQAPAQAPGPAPMTGNETRRVCLWTRLGWHLQAIQIPLQHLNDFAHGWAIGRLHLNAP
ncbi:uncharacterized protein LOC108511170 [Phoenix dactylifera]|uniref:Uncharacterized protein LOC108511170 n=1 Tax=Phoenix dactylifera TaxID=42345 RepID=A0A8B7MU48_PHODC|nr:uncharacterized protein LOC108511170 [Phoenix dactylifera]